jgi:hypothetical protein
MRMPYGQNPSSRYRGDNESALGVDGESVFSAARLYEACGFRIAKRNALYGKPVDRAAIA